MNNEQKEKVINEFDEMFEYTRHGIIEKRPSHLGNKYHDDFEIIKSFLLSKIDQAIEAERIYVEKAIDENIAISRMTHRVGSHSDDFDGANDYPFDCDEEKRETEVEALSNLKTKLKL